MRSFLLLGRFFFFAHASLLFLSEASGSFCIFLIIIFNLIQFLFFKFFYSLQSQSNCPFFGNVLFIKKPKKLKFACITSLLCGSFFEHKTHLTCDFICGHVSFPWYLACKTYVCHLVWWGKSFLLLPNSPSNLMIT